MNRVHAIEDHSDNTILAMSEIIARSTSREHFVYREAELDDLWRLVHTALEQARDDTRRGRDVQDLAKLLAVVAEAHDLVGRDEDPQAAARHLRDALTSSAHE